MKRFARTIIGLGLKRVSKQRAAWVVGLVGDQDPRLMQAAWKAAMAFDSRSRLSEIRCPTLVIAGSQDSAVPMHNARMLHEGIARSALTIVEGAYHALIWERPEEFVGVVEHFLT
jgi:3-oxoadipate enol-lactonase